MKLFILYKYINIFNKWFFLSVKSYVLNKLKYWWKIIFLNFVKIYIIKQILIIFINLKFHSSYSGFNDLALNSSSISCDSESWFDGKTLVQNSLMLHQIWSSTTNASYVWSSLKDTVIYSLLYHWYPVAFDLVELMNTHVK